MKQKMGGIITAISVAAFVVSVFATIPTFAAANIFKIQNAEFGELSKTAEVTNTSFDESKITSDFTVHELNDAVEYRVNLKNTDDKAHVIKGITDDANNNSFITFKYDQHINEVIEAGSDLELVVTATYANDNYTNDSARESVINTKFTIQYADVAPAKSEETPAKSEETPATSGEEAPATPNTESVEIETPTVPDTGVNSSFSEYAKFSIVSLVVSAGFMIICLVVFKKNKKAGKIIIASVITVAVFTATNTVKAEAIAEDSFTIETNFILRDRLYVTWEDENGRKHKDLVYYNDYLGVKIEEKEGYTFTGWVDNNGRQVDLNEPVMDDMEIHQTFRPNQYHISFNGNKADSEDPMPIEMVYNEAVKLPSKPYTREGYYFMGWNTEADGSGDNYADGQEVKNLTTMDNGEVTLYAQWQKKYLQIMTNELLEQELPEVGATTVLYDNRDEEAYVVGKLADGNYWLLDNLRLDPAEVSLNTLKGNTNASDTALEYLKGVKTGTTSDRYALSAVSNEWPESYDVYGMPYVKSDLKNDIAENGYAGKTGVFYNFCAASAGTYCYGNDEHIVTYHGRTNNPKESWGEPLVQEIATEDICPAGWQLPKSGKVSSGSTDYSDFETLAKSYETDTDFVDLFRIPDVKHIQDGVVFGNTMFWGRNRLANAEENYISTTLISGRTNPIYASQSGRQMGMSVRCMKK